MHKPILRYLGAGTLVALATAGPTTSAVLAQTLQRQLYVSVVDAAGNPVAGLMADDFIIRENDQRREVLRVGPATTGMQIALLVDTSAAATYAINEMRAAFSEFVERLLPGNEIAIIAFGERPTVRVDYTDSLETLQRSIGRLFAMPGAGAYLLDAMDLTLEGFTRRRAQRPVMVVVTTAGAEYSNVYYEAVLRDLKETGAAFHAIVLESETNGVFDEAARDRIALIDRGTRASGGRRHDLITTMALEQTLRQVGEDLASQYLVEYARPDSLIPPDRITVDVENPNLTARGTPVRSMDGS